MSARPSSPAAAPAWQVWTGLGIVYLVWGSTYLAIRIMVETVPPLLGAGLRFGTAGAVVLVVVAATRGRAAVAIDRRVVLSAFIVGTLLTGGNAVITVAEQEVPSALAALLVATVPLWVILMRRVAGERVSRTTVAAIAVGFLGVAILLRPGDQAEGASALALAGVLFGALMWASGSFASPRVPLPPNPFTSTGWQMLLGGAAWILAGLVFGEAPEVEPSRFSAESVAAFFYLIVFGSLLAFTAYVWLLQHAPLSKVATYAYVNPVVAMALGWLILSETITLSMLAGAAVIVGSVALVVRGETPASAPSGAGDDDNLAPEGESGLRTGARPAILAPSMSEPDDPLR